MGEQGWVRLGALIRSERSKLWRTRADFSAVTGLSVRLLADLETGARSRYKPETLSTIEGALGWAYGSCDRVVAGGKVIREVDPSLARMHAVWPRLSRDARAMLADLAERNVGR